MFTHYDYDDNGHLKGEFHAVKNDKDIPVWDLYASAAGPISGPDRGRELAAAQHREQSEEGQKRSKGTRRKWRL